MSDDKDIDYAREEALRYRMETSKERSILIRNWLYTGIALIVAVMLVWALWSWRQANNMAGATSAKLNGILDKLDTKVDAIDVSRANDLIAAGTAAVRDVQPVEQELAGAVADLRYQTGVLSQSVTARLETLDGVMARLNEVADEGRLQIKQNGDATARLIADSDASVNGGLVPELTESVKAARVLMDRFGATADEASAAIHQASEQTGKSVDELNQLIVASKATIDATGATVNDFHGDLHNTMKEWPAIARDVQKTTHNISRFSKISIIAGIISNLANGFIPALLH